MDPDTYDARVTRRRRASGTARSPTKSPARKPTLSKSSARKPSTTRPHVETQWEDANPPRSAGDVEYISPINLSPNVTYSQASTRRQKTRGPSHFLPSLCQLCTFLLATVLALFITIPLKGWSVFKPVVIPPCELNVVYTSFPALCTWAKKQDAPLSADDLIRDTQFLSNILFELLYAVPYVSRSYRAVEWSSVWISTVERLSDDIRFHEHGFPWSAPLDMFGTIISLKSHLRTVPLKVRLFESGYAPYLQKLGGKLKTSAEEMESGIAAYKSDQRRDTKRLLAPYIPILDIYSCRHHYIRATQKVIDETKYDLINLVNNTETFYQVMTSASKDAHRLDTALRTADGRIKRDTRCKLTAMDKIRGAREEELPALCRLKLSDGFKSTKDNITEIAATLDGIRTSLRTVKRDIYRAEKNLKRLKWIPWKRMVEAERFCHVDNELHYAREYAALSTVEDGEMNTRRGPDLPPDVLMADRIRRAN